jgi:glycosyltransferase involved in cell wall biosynthesis
MKTRESSTSSLSIITPVTLMAGKLDKLKSWLIKLEDYDFETILVHDKRDEKTSLEIIDFLHSLSNRNVKLYEGRYGSPGTARNVGIQVASAEWVCFWDSDDFPHLENVRVLVDSLCNSNIDCIIGSFNRVNEISGIKEVKSLGRNFQVDLALNPGIWRFIFRKKSFGDLTFTSLLMGEDQVFLANYLKNDTKYVVRNECVYTYFVGSANHLTKQKKALNDSSLAAEALLNIAKSKSNYIKKIVSIMFANQFLRAIKYSTLSGKLKSVRIFLSALLFSKNEFRLMILTGMYKAIRDKIHI